MDTSNISSRNLRSILILMVLCSSLINGALTLKQDTWIAILLMAVLYLPLMLLYIRLGRLFPEKGFFDIIEELFGRVGGGILTFVFVCYAILVGSLILQNYAEFTVVMSLQQTPIIPIMILILLAALYLAVKGPKLLGRWSFLICILIVFHFLITFFLSIPVMKPSYIFPMLDHGIGEIVQSSYAMGCIAVGESMMILVLFGYTKKSQHPAKIILPGIFIGIILFALTVLRNLFVLGPALEQEAQFSTYMAVRIIKVGNFLERLESSISINYILLGLTKLTFLLIAASMGVAQLFQTRDYKRFLIPTGLLTISLSAIAFKNVMEMHDFVWVYSYFSIPFQILLPLLVWIVAECKAKKHGSAVIS